MHLKKLLKLLEQGPKAFNMVKCHPLTSNKNSINFLCQHLFRHRHDLPPNSGKMGRVCHHLIPAYGRGKGLSVFQLSACSLPFGPTLDPPWPHLLQVEIENRKSRTSQGRAEGLPGRRTFHPRFVTARIQVRTGGGSGGGGNFW